MDSGVYYLWIQIHFQLVCVWERKGLLVLVFGEQYWYSFALDSQLYRIGLAEQTLFLVFD